MKKLVAASLLALASVGASATTLTFDAAPQGYTSLASYSEGGYTFTMALGAGGFSTHVGDGTGTTGTLNWHDGGDNGSGVLIKLTKDGGGLFDLNSLFLDAPYGGTLTLSATGYGPLAFASTGNQSVGFLGVSEVTFANSNGNGLGIDNVSIDASQVPEPGVLALMGLGLAGLRCARKRTAKTVD